LCYPVPWRGLRRRANAGHGSLNKPETTPLPDSTTFATLPLGTVVEVKFMRPGKLFQDVIEEIAADASLYATDPRWTSLIPFVWDDARRIEEHQKLVAGLEQLPMVIGAVVVSRPGKMDRPPQA